MRSSPESSGWSRRPAPRGSCDAVGAGAFGSGGRRKHPRQQRRAVPCRPSRRQARRPYPAGAGPVQGRLLLRGACRCQGQAHPHLRPSPKNPAVFATDTTGILQLVQASYIEVENLHIKRARATPWHSMMAAHSISPATTSPSATFASRMLAPKALPTPSSWRAFRTSPSPTRRSRNGAREGLCHLRRGLQERVDRPLHLSAGTRFRRDSVQGGLRVDRHSPEFFDDPAPRGSTSAEHRHAVLPSQAPGL